MSRQDKSAQRATSNTEQTFRRRVFEILEVAARSDRVSWICDNFLIILIVTNVIAVILQTVEPIHHAYGSFFDTFELVSIGIFSLEYCLRVWAWVESEEHQSQGANAFHSRIKYMMKPLALIDLASILPFYFAFMTGLDLRFLRILRLLRVLKLTRYSPALTLLLRVLKEESSTLVAAFFVLMLLLILSASGIYIFEHEAQPTAFGSIPAAMWWAMATLTTVGYGDVTPITVGGKIFGSLITIIGIGTAALPAGILASGFVTQISRHRASMARKIDKALVDGEIDRAEQREIDEMGRQLGVSWGLIEEVHAERLDKLSGELAKKLASAAPEHPKCTCPHCGAPMADAEETPKTATNN